MSTDDQAFTIALIAVAILFVILMLLPDVDDEEDE
jgi:hypothetical protein